MKHLVAAAMIAMITLAGPVATQSMADDAHHPEKGANAKKATKAKAKPRSQQKIDRSKKGETRLGSDVRKA